MKTIAIITCLALCQMGLFAQPLHTADVTSCQSLKVSAIENEDFFPPDFQKEILNAQSLSEGDILDSFYYWSWDALLSQWLLDNRVFFTYDDNGNIFTQLYLSWDGNQWVNLDRNVYTYDNNNNVLLDLYQVWNGISFDNSYQIMYTYDSQNDRTSIVDQNWDGVVWVNNSHILYTYDASHNLLTQTSGLWNGADWQNTLLQSFSYDVNNRRILRVVQNWNGGWVNNQQVMSTYDANNDLEMDLNQRWVVDHWEDNYRYLYESDGNQNLLSVLRQNPIGGNMWIDEYHFLYTYDLFNNNLSQLYQSYINDEWINNYQFLLSYDPNQNQLTEVFQVWEDEWINEDSTHFYYTLFTGLKEERQDQKGFLLYPNPATTTLIIETGEEAFEELRLDIYSSEGIRVWQSRLKSFSEESLDISQLPPGFYHIVIQSEKGRLNRNFLKL